MGNKIIWTKNNEYVGQSRIKSKIDEVNQFKSSYDITKESEREYERQKANNKTNVIRNAIESVYEKGATAVGGLTYNRAKDIIFDGGQIPGITGNLPDASILIPPRAVGPLEEMPLATMYSDSIMLQNIVSKTMIAAEHRLRANLAVKKTVEGIGPNKYYKESGQQYSPVEDSFDINEFTFAIKNTAMTGKAYPTGAYQGFPAFIKTFNESLGATWDSVHFINATEDKYIYQKGDRSFTLEFTLFSTFADEFEITEIRQTQSDRNRAMGIPDLETYPIFSAYELEYSLEFLNKLIRPKVENNIITEVPYCYLTMGNMFHNQKCIFDGVSLNYEMLWDLNLNSVGYLKPKIVEVTLTGKFLHENPSTDTRYYARGQL